MTYMRSLGSSAKLEPKARGAQVDEDGKYQSSVLSCRRVSTMSCQLTVLKQTNKQNGTTRLLFQKEHSNSPVKGYLKRDAATKGAR